MLMPFLASFPASSASAPGLFGSSTCSSVPSAYESPAPSRAFLALFMLSTNTCTEPCVPAVLFSRAMIFTLASARVLATCAKVPGRFSPVIVRCLPFAIGGSSCSALYRNYALEGTSHKDLSHKSRWWCMEAERGGDANSELGRSSSSRKLHNPLAHHGL